MTEVATAARATAVQGSNGQNRGNVAASPFCSALVRLAEGGATVGTPSLAQREAEEEAQGEEEDGTQDSQAGEVVLQDADSAGGTASSWLPCDQTMASRPFTTR